MMQPYINTRSITIIVPIRHCSLTLTIRIFKVKVALKTMIVDLGNRTNKSKKVDTIKF